MVFPAQSTTFSDQPSLEAGLHLACKLSPPRPYGPQILEFPAFSFNPRQR